MKKLSLTLLAAAALSVVPAQATTLGLFDPYGRNGNPGVQYALWDDFLETLFFANGSNSTYTYSGIPSGSSTLTNLSLNQTLPHINATTGGGAAQGAGLLNDGDVYYSSTKPQSWTLTAKTSIDVTTITFQVKTGNVDAATWDNVFLPTLDGVGAATYVQHVQLDEKIFGSFDSYVIEYVWTGLNLAAGADLNITFSLAGGFSGDYTRKPIDFIALDVATVPEPSICALLGLGLGLAARQIRRCRANA